MAKQRTGRYAVPDGLLAMNDRGLRSTVCTPRRPVIEAAAAAQRIQVLPYDREQTAKAPLLPRVKSHVSQGSGGRSGKPGISNRRTV